MTHFSVTPAVPQTPAKLLGVNRQIRADTDKYFAIFDLDAITPMLHTEITFGGIYAKPSVPIDGHDVAGPEEPRDPASVCSPLAYRIQLVQHRFDGLASIRPRRTDQPGGTSLHPTGHEQARNR